MVPASGRSGAGFLVLVCAEQGDTSAEADKLLGKLLKLRVFGDAQGKMNHSIQNMDGTRHPGRLVAGQPVHAALPTCRAATARASKAARSPADGRRLYDYLVEQARLAHPIVQTGRFATDMAGGVGE